MKFLCLHGSGTNSDVFEVQLSALISELSKDDAAEFVFVDGEMECSPAPGVVEFFPDGPYYCYYPWSHTTDEGNYWPGEMTQVFQLIYDVLQEEGPFSGILGFSQGATVVAAFLLNHANSHPYDVPSSLFQYAVFFAGAAPFRTDGSGRRMAPADADEGERIRIPTVHIAGEKDSVYQGSLDLYELCSSEIASFIPHGGGHVIPREKRVVEKMANAIRKIDQQSLMRC